MEWKSINSLLENKSVIIGNWSGSRLNWVVGPINRNGKGLWKCGAMTYTPTHFMEITSPNGD
jgi:hypothetical protein